MAPPGATVPPAPGSAVELRPAVTMMVVRDGEHRVAPLEVLMVRRSLNSQFMGGKYVFPGGAVEAQDRDPAVQARCRGRDDLGASTVLGLGSGGLAHWVAAVRECFEEAGLLVACRRAGGADGAAPAGGPAISTADAAQASRLAAHRHALNSARAIFADLLAGEDLELTADAVHYFAHWITPEGAPRRYDTRFFVAPAPPDQTPAHDAQETIAEVWLRPPDAIEMHRREEIELVLPTLRTLQAMARFPDAGSLLAAAARLDVVPAVVPRVVPDGRGWRIVLPGDPGYEEAAGSPAPSVAAFDHASQAASEAARGRDDAVGLTGLGRAAGR